MTLNKTEQQLIIDLIKDKINECEIDIISSQNSEDKFAQKHVGRIISVKRKYQDLLTKYQESINI